MSSPFTEHEKRFLLAEIIKTSRIPLNSLLGLIREENVDPNWMEIWTPTGRNLNSCISAFQDIWPNAPPPLQPTFGVERPPALPLKRRFSDTEPASATTRTLQPKPAANGDQSVPRGSPVDPSVRKRGRPSKEMLEARRAEAAVRGPPYPPLKAAAGRKSTGSVPTGQMSFGYEGAALGPRLEAVGSVENPHKKRRGRPTKEEAEAKKMMELASGAIEAQKAPPKLYEAPSQPVEEILVVESTPQAPTVSTPRAPEVPESIETVQSHTVVTQPSPLS